jgi:hypothetical protein
MVLLSDFREILPFANDTYQLVKWHRQRADQKRKLQSGNCQIYPKQMTFNPKNWT